MNRALNDATIAHRDMPGLGSGLPGHEKFDIDYVLARRPGIILLGVYGLDPRPLPPAQLVRYSYEAEWWMLDAPRFRDEYELRRALGPRADTFPILCGSRNRLRPRPTDRPAAAGGGRGS